MSTSVTTTEREASLEAFFRIRVRQLGGYCVKLAPTEAGVPDRLVMLPSGRMYLVELKAEDGSVSPIQHLWHRRIRQLGGQVHVLYGRDGIVNWLRFAVGTGHMQKRRYRRRVTE